MSTGYWNKLTSDVVYHKVVACNIIAKPLALKSCPFIIGHLVVGNSRWQMAHAWISHRYTAGVYNVES